MNIETEGPLPKRRRAARKRKTTETQMASPLPIEEQPLIPVEDNPANQSDGKPVEVDDNEANFVPGTDKIVVQDNEANEVPDPVTNVEPKDNPYPEVEPPPKREPIVIPEPENKPEPENPVVVPEGFPEPGAEPEPEETETDAGEKSPAAAFVKIRCVSYARPRVAGGPLHYGEKAKVPRELAETMARNGLVELV